MDGPPRLADLAVGDEARGRSWTEYGIAELIEHLVTTHHAYLVSEVPRLLELGARLAVEGAPLQHLDAAMTVLDQLDEELGPHLATEEEVLFPWCQRLLAGEPVGDWVAARVRCMRRDHVATESLLAELGRLTDNFAVPDSATPACRAFLVGLAGFVADTRLHIHKEEDVLFPALLDGLAAGTPAGG